MFVVEIYFLLRFNPSCATVSQKKIFLQVKCICEYTIYHQYMASKKIFIGLVLALIWMVYS